MERQPAKEPQPLTVVLAAEFIKHDDFELFVTDDEGFPAAVLPMGRRGSGDARVQVIAAHPGSRHAHELARANRQEKRYAMQRGTQLSKAAFRHQS